MIPCPATACPPLLLVMDPVQIAFTVGGLVLIIAMLLWNSYRKTRLANRQGSAGRIRDFLNSDRTDQGLRDDMQRLLAELLEATREIEAQLDTKFRKLDLLIGQADERITELRRLSGLPPEPPAAADGSAGAAAASAKAPAKSSAKSAKRPPVRLVRGPDADDAESAAEPAEPDSADEAAPAVDHAAVYKLADAGRTPRQIAVELGKAVGEIELILALRKK